MNTLKGCENLRFCGARRWVHVPWPFCSEPHAFVVETDYICRPAWRPAGQSLPKATFSRRTPSLRANLPLLNTKLSFRISYGIKHNRFMILTTLLWHRGNMHTAMDKKWSREPSHSSKFNLRSENKSNENENRMRTKINELEHRIGRAESRVKRTNVDC